MQMSFWQRPYAGGGGGGTTLGLPRATPAVKVLLAVNFAMFLLQQFFDRSTPFSLGWMSTYLGATVEGSLQLWRYITFQFLHAGIWHILMNMLGVYMLGPPLEERMGTRRFVAFYLSCGVVAGLAYVAIGLLASLPPWVPIVGASGGVFAILLACAVYFPDFKIVLVLFLVPIRFAAVIVFGAMIFMVLSSLAGPNQAGAMSDVAHLGGAVGAAFWIWVLPRLRGADAVGRIKRGHWRRKMLHHEAQLLQERAEVDRVLQKVKEKGIASLSAKDKKILQDATRRQQQRDGGPN